MKAPTECKSIVEVRHEIDILDREIIKLIGKRFEYVKVAARFKSNNQEVKAPERFKAMLLKRREWAQAEGLNPSAIEKLYVDLVNHFINEELQLWKKESPDDGLLTEK